MEKDANCIQYLLHSPNSWEPHHMMSNISFFSDYVVQRRQRMNVKRISNVNAPHTKSGSHGSKSKSKPIKEVVCKYCEKVFVTQNALVVHIRSHKGERPFSCTICNITFVSKGHLSGHLRTHTGEKPFQCVECLKVFSQKSSFSTILAISHI